MGLTHFIAKTAFNQSNNKVKDGLNKTPKNGLRNN